MSAATLQPQGVNPPSPAVFAAGRDPAASPVHVLIVCAGNLRRSPMAAALWRHRFRDQPMRVQSAGLYALTGVGIDPQVEAVLAEHGLSGRPHVARQVTAALVEAADLVLTMDCTQAVAVQALTPCASGRTFTLGKWLGGIEIPDPYPGSPDAYDRAFRLIERAVDAWHQQLNGRFRAAMTL